MLDDLPIRPAIIAAVCLTLALGVLVGVGATALVSVARHAVVTPLPTVH